ncbi:MAG: hypothetical protein JNJ45_04500 [Chthonomonas sp.]|nr:hypothetical protein [Chthonomonas sp.]
MAIGFLDLISTAVLHAHGKIEELNPVMRPIIQHSEWAFVFVKALTLITCWATMVWYWPQNSAFVRRTCLIGSAVYFSIWLAWFLIGTHS